MLGMASVGGAVAYSFPEIIVPKNIVVPGIVPIGLEGLPFTDGPALIEDIFFY